MKRRVESPEPTEEDKHRMTLEEFPVPRPKR